MPAPISPSTGARSNTMTRNPFWARPRAVAKPPMPPPAIRMGLSCCMVFPPWFRLVQAQPNGRAARRVRRVGLLASRSQGDQDGGVGSRTRSGVRSGLAGDPQRHGGDVVVDVGELPEQPQQSRAI